MLTRNRSARPGLISTLSAAALLTLGTGFAHAQTYEMVISHLLPEDLTDNEIAPAMAHFESLVEARTGGDIDVQVFGAGALGSEVETGKQAQASIHTPQIINAVASHIGQLQCQEGQN